MILMNNIEALIWKKIMKNNNTLEFLKGFYLLSSDDQAFLRKLIKDYNAGQITDQEFSARLQERKTTAK